MFRKTTRFFRHPVFVQGWFLPVFVGLGLARLAILVVSFRRLVPRLGVSVGVVPWVPLLDQQQAERARLISQVVLLAARYAPWNANCFPRAVVARSLLGLFGVPYCLFFGVRRTNGRFDAHAWVASGSVRVTGGTGFNRYAVVGVFVMPQLANELASQSSSHRQDLGQSPARQC